jgi:dihydroorotase-like cyclic amidohydrolase
MTREPGRVPDVAAPEAIASRLLVRGGTAVDRTGERRVDVRIVEGRIVEVGPGLDVADGEAVLDAQGCLVAPGFVDLHTHLR